MAGRREQTVARILDGAAAAFAKGGFAGTSMEEIASAAGVSKLLLYRDFAGKQELYQAVLERTLNRVVEEVPLAASNDSLQALIAVARSDPDGFVLAFRHAAREPVFAGFVADVLERWVRASEKLLRPIEPDPTMRRWAAEMTMQITYQSIITWLEHGDPARDEEFFRRLLSVNRAVAKPPPAPHGERPHGERPHGERGAR
ncbi:MAG: TetR/AcrR family transcriptional regulator [Micromonosporaceae bacterium]|nr:TetR/AcrR family transcriptional regulator [Micromonosporaceae bacterium]